MTLLVPLLIACAKPVPPASGDAPPELLDVGARPKVPKTAARDGVSGTFTVRVDLDERGHPTARMEGYTREDVAASCTTYWNRSRWTPAYRDGVAVPHEGITVSCTLTVDD
jgi:hypothetical protein